jgi:hypothetical protein
VEHDRRHGDVVAHRRHRSRPCSCPTRRRPRRRSPGGRARRAWRR